VLLIRSELLRRYPDAVIYAVRGAEESQPIFTGAFAPDVRYAGFDIPSAEIATWSIVLMVTCHSHVRRCLRTKLSAP